MHIRPAELADAEALTDLHLDVWEEAYGDLVDPGVLRERRRTRRERAVRWAEILERSRADTLLACSDEGRLLGFTSAGPGRDDPSEGLPALEVWALYVRAEVYGTGVGFALLQAAAGSGEAYLYVLDGNRRAIAFYERQGFGFDGHAKREPVGVERRMVRRTTRER
ncbi:N-acetyltransferase [Marmoricola endophyticus]|uniref:N-acetyltransferase n=1 Tax=Marmoricola endophyticus TaxID=2040280 RepID=A0A917BBR7_9ACTN|nr:N-acetyltransferase [Marmoricola endophyticus]